MTWESKALIQSLGCVAGWNILKTLSERMMSFDTAMTLFGTTLNESSSQPQVYAGVEWPGLFFQTLTWLSLDINTWIMYLAPSTFFAPVMIWKWYVPGPA